MNKKLLILSLLFLLPVNLLAGQASTYNLQASPSSGVISNVAIDVIEHSGVVWLATGKGISFSSDGGITWQAYTEESGLVGEDVSAIYSQASRLWAGVSRDTLINGRLFSWSEGLIYTDDSGTTWSQVNFGSSGLNIGSVWGGDRTIFDISGHVDTGYFNQLQADTETEWLFFSAFAGGLLASQDGGVSWRRIFPNRSDSLQFVGPGEPSFRNRVFSCAVDTSHGDTLMVWSGTAGGLFQYVFVPPREKYFQRRVSAIAFCDSCTSTSSSIPVYIGGDFGLSIGRITGGPYESRFQRDSLPGNVVTAMLDVAGRLFVGLRDSISGNTGLAISADQGKTFSPVTIPGLTGTSNEIISDFEMSGGKLFLAADSAGLFRSDDSGLTWVSVPVDTFTSQAITTVNTVAVQFDTLLLGTDSGMVSLYTSSGLTVTDSSSYTLFAENANSSQRIIEIEVQNFYDTLSVLDSSIVWTINRAVTAQGEDIVGRRGISIVTTPILDTSYVWSNLQVQAETYDIEFSGTFAYVAGEQGVRFTSDGSNPAVQVPIRQLDPFGGVIDEFSSDTITTIVFRGDTVLVGASSGYAYSFDRASTFRIVRPNLDTLSADFVVNYTFLTSLNFDDQSYGLTGDFIPALDIQYPDTGGTAFVWVSARPVEGGFSGRSVGRFIQLKTDTIIDTFLIPPDTVIDSLGYQLRWQAIDTTNFAWNFAFSGDSVFSASNGGLFLDTGFARFDSTQVIPIVNTAVSGDLVDPDAAVFGVRPIGNDLWITTDDGTVRFSLGFLNDGVLIAKVDSTTPAEEVYAYPVPFSPIRGGKIDFHFVVDQPGYVTLEVYDFAMNLVARPIDNIFYNAGIYPDGVTQGIQWDGINGRGDVVAVGVYYFKVEVSSGETRWGKLAVMP